MRLRTLLFLALIGWSVRGEKVVVERLAERQAINPLIYGINFAWEGSKERPAAAANIRATTRRWGGNTTSRYNWKLDISNLASDWYFEVLPDPATEVERLPGGSSFDKMVDAVRASGGVMMGTVPILGWTAKARLRMCSFPVERYGAQCRTDPYWRSCGNGQRPDCRTNLVNDPTEVHAWQDESFAAEWVRYVAGRYGRANQGGVAIWSLDNEPVWWSATHRDIHPEAQEYDETVEKGIRYARAVKQADPTALVAGPVSAGWESLYFSLRDCNAGWSSRGVNGGKDWQYWNNPVDRRAHGGVAFVPWYLQKFREAEEREGVRLLDVLDVHGYVAPEGIMFSRRGDAALERLRLTSTRVFWDPNYTAEWLPNVEELDSPEYGKPVQPALVPRMKRWVKENYPGLQTAITEYHWGAAESITGAIAQADLLGIFGREGLDIATLWAPSTPEAPLAFAFRMFRNYDGQGSTFGETSVRAAAENVDQVAAFAAERSDGALTVLLLNKRPEEQEVELAVGEGNRAELWRYSEADLTAIVRVGEERFESGAWRGRLPGYSMSLLVIPAEGAGEARPQVLEVLAAGARTSGVMAPGQEMLVRGEGMGLADGGEAALGGEGERMEETPWGEGGMRPKVYRGQRVWVDGVAAPIQAMGAGVIRFSAPFFLRVPARVRVEVEANGRRSAAVWLQTAATNPRLFTVSETGVGQARARVEATGEWNGAGRVVAPGAVVLLEGSGGGETDPGGVDGRKAEEIVAKMREGCRAWVGEREAKVEACTELPGDVAGRFQMRVRLPAELAGGEAVPVRVRIGAGESQAGVTMAVQ